MEYEEEEFCQCHILEIRPTASSLQWRSEINGLFSTVNLMLCDMRVIYACECFFNLMGLSVRLNSSRGLSKQQLSSNF